MATTLTGTNKLNVRLLEIAETIMGLAREVTGERRTKLSEAASLWACAYDDTRSRGVVTPNLVALAMRADSLAAEGGYEGPWFAQELVAMAAPRPKGPRMAVTHLGRVAIPEDFEV
ncbi:hypothetical protein [Streptomyces sp. NPDC051572]|jgi:hypothetical protein|uniref:hypothetical protein n=1 Tax=Streptomyces sp. NPDC051572 TaxID=3155802 RepID=UPI00344B2C99